MQFDLFLETEVGDEDCLFLNVYTSQVNTRIASNLRDEMNAES